MQKYAVHQCYFINCHSLFTRQLYEFRSLCGTKEWLQPYELTAKVKKFRGVVQAKTSSKFQTI